MEKYIYDLENEIVETFNKEEIPIGLEFKTIIFEIDNTEIINNEIEILDKETTSNISELLAKHIEKKQIENIEIPNEVLLKRQKMISEFHIKKNEIIAKYSI